MLSGLLLKKKKILTRYPELLGGCVGLSLDRGKLMDRLLECKIEERGNPSMNDSNQVMGYWSPSKQSSGVIWDHAMAVTSPAPVITSFVYTTKQDNRDFSCSNGYASLLACLRGVH